MPDVRNNIIWTLRDEVSKTAVKLNKQLDGIGLKSKGATGAIAKLGISTGGLVTPTSLAAGGALALAAGVAEVTRMAIEEEKNIAKLDAALEANVASWDGNRESIEAVIEEHGKLAFSDDDLRDSLAILVAATHDVTEAQELQTTAMDLARLKGISLKEASEALIKVEAGQYRMLKTLGIQLRDGATQTEALAAVQKVAGGQAEKYGETTAGAMESAQIALDNVAEDIGVLFLPAVKEAAEALRDDIIPAVRDAVTQVTGLATAIGDVLGTEIPIVDQSIGDLGATLRDTVNPFKVTQGAAEAMLDAMDALGLSTDATRQQFRDFGVEVEDSADHSADAVEEMRGSIEWDTAEVAEDIGFMDRAMQNFEQTVQIDTRNVGEYFEDMREALVEEVGIIIGDAFDPIQDRLDAQATHWKITTDIAALEAARGKEAVNAATQDIITDLDNQAETLMDLGESHKLTAKDVDQYEKDVRASYRAIGKKVPPEVELVLKKLRELQGFDGKNINVDVYTRWQNTHGKTGKGPTITDNAMGYVGTTKGRTLTNVGWMGEAGTEAYAILRNPKPIKSTDGFMSGGDQTYLSAPKAAAVTQPSGQPVVIALQLDGRTVAQVVDEHLFYAAQRSVPTLARL